MSAAIFAAKTSAKGRVLKRKKVAEEEAEGDSEMDDEDVKSDGEKKTAEKRRVETFQQQRRHE